jgi:hypothetical protein
MDDGDGRMPDPTEVLVAAEDVERMQKFPVGRRSLHVARGFSFS